MELDSYIKLHIKINCRQSKYLCVKTKAYKINVNTYVLDIGIRKKNLKQITKSISIKENTDKFYNVKSKKICLSGNNMGIFIDDIN